MLFLVVVVAWANWMVELARILGEVMELPPINPTVGTAKTGGGNYPLSVFRIRIHYNAEPDPVPSQFGSESRNRD